MPYQRKKKKLKRPRTFALPRWKGRRAFTIKQDPSSLLKKGRALRKPRSKKLAFKIGEL
jgi:hypothetical protein